LLEGGKLSQTGSRDKDHTVWGLFEGGQWLALSRPEERWGSYSFGLIRKRIKTSSIKRRGEMGILLFWACMKRVVGTSLKSGREMGTLKCWAC
jgi:hypothetical protein